jgi:hypothetical protein
MLLNSSSGRALRWLNCPKIASAAGVRYDDDYHVIWRGLPEQQEDVRCAWAKNNGIAAPSAAF